MKKQSYVLGLIICLVSFATLSMAQIKPEYSNPGFGPRQIRVEGGMFSMGGSLPENIAYSNDVHKREIRVKDILMDEHEVTNKQWKEFVAAKGQAFKPDTTLEFSYGLTVRNYYNNPAYDEYPVVGITWEQAVAFCEWRTSQVNDGGADFRLPTEEEWEYAAISLNPKTTLSKKSPVDHEIVTAGKTYPWFGTGLRFATRGRSHRADRGSFLANFKAENEGAPVKIASYWPNDFYLYDMAGNVNEWVLNQYQQFPDENQRKDLSPEAFPMFGMTSLVNEKSRIIKGGSWEDDPYWLIPATRRHFQQDQASTTIGFRTVRDYTKQKLDRDKPLTKRTPISIN